MRLCHLYHEVLVKKLVDGFTEFAKVTLAQWNENESMVEFILAFGMPWANSSNSSLECLKTLHLTTQLLTASNPPTHLKGGDTMINIPC